MFYCKMRALLNKLFSNFLLLILQLLSNFLCRNNWESNNVYFFSYSMSHFWHLNCKKSSQMAQLFILCMLSLAIHDWDFLKFHDCTLFAFSRLKF